MDAGDLKQRVYQLKFMQEVNIFVNSRLDPDKFQKDIVYLYNIEKRLSPDIS